MFFKWNLQLNGQNTLGENIADNGGVREGFRAYQNYIQNNNGGKPEPKLPGLHEYTSEQMFFISFSQVYWIANKYIYHDLCTEKFIIPG